MARRRTNPVAPRRTREHVIGDLAVNHVERFVLNCSYTVERTRYDYGIDLLMATYDANGEAEDGWIPIQVRATERLSVLRRENVVAFRVGRREVVAWLRQSLPVILVVYDVVAERAYWLHVQAYFAAQPGFNIFEAAETMTIRIPRTAVLDVAAVRRIAALRDEALE